MIAVAQARPIAPPTTRTETPPERATLVPSLNSPAALQMTRGWRPDQWSDWLRDSTQDQRDAFNALGHLILAKHGISLESVRAKATERAETCQRVIEGGPGGALLCGQPIGQRMTAQLVTLGTPGAEDGGRARTSRYCSECSVVVDRGRMHAQKFTLKAAQLLRAAGVAVG